MQGTAVHIDAIFCLFVLLFVQSHIARHNLISTLCTEGGFYVAGKLPVPLVVLVSNAVIFKLIYMHLGTFAVALIKYSLDFLPINTATICNPNPRLALRVNHIIFTNQPQIWCRLLLQSHL